MPTCPTCHSTVSALPLTKREAQIARLVLRGYAYETAGDTLHLSHNTIKQVMRRVRLKCGVTNNAALAETETARKLLA